jgi:hypothetical protein
MSIKHTTYPAHTFNGVSIDPTSEVQTRALLLALMVAKNIIRMDLDATAWKVVDWNHVAKHSG